MFKSLFYPFRKFHPLLMVLFVFVGCKNDYNQDGSIPVIYYVDAQNSQELRESLTSLKARKPSLRVYRNGCEFQDDTVPTSHYYYYNINLKDGQDSLMFKLRIHEGNSDEPSIQVSSICKYTDNWIDSYGPTSPRLDESEKKRYYELFETQVLDELDNDWSEGWFENFFNGLF